jgi:PTS system fructose-specific IIC component
MALHAASPAPHGGIWVIGLIGKPLAWLVAIVAGTAVSAACVVVAKGLGHRAAAGSGGRSVQSPKVAVAG